jgi:hypothetical protein
MIEESTNSRKDVLFLAYGSNNAYYGVIFCIFTLYYHLNKKWGNLHLVIYTDNSEIFNKYFSSFPITYEYLSKEQIAEWIKPYGYIHRMKTCILKDCFAKHGNDILYTDGDTFFLKDPTPLIDQINEKVSVLCNFEGDMNDSGEHENVLWTTLRSILRDNQFTLHGKSFKIPFTTQMWNAGITGLSSKNAYLMDDVLSITDQIFGAKPLFYAEQFALNYVVQNYSGIIPSEDYILHYWQKINNVKPFDTHIKLFIETNKSASLDELTQKAYSLTLQFNQLKDVAIKEPLIKRLRYRLKLITQVAKKGYID